MLTKAKVAIQVTELLNGMPVEERRWVLERCRKLVGTERGVAVQVAQRVMHERGELTPAETQAFAQRAETFRTLERILDELEKVVPA